MVHFSHWKQENTIPKRQLYTSPRSKEIFFLSFLFPIGEKKKKIRDTFFHSSVLLFSGFWRASFPICFASVAGPQ